MFCSPFRHTLLLVSFMLAGGWAQAGTKYFKNTTSKGMAVTLIAGDEIQSYQVPSGKEQKIDYRGYAAQEIVVTYKDGEGWHTKILKDSDGINGNMFFTCAREGMSMRP